MFHRLAFTRGGLGKRQQFELFDTLDLPTPVPRVLWAIDFIRGAEGLLAVDFNTAPELITLGEAGPLTEAEVKLQLDHAAVATPPHLLQF